MKNRRHFFYLFLCIGWISYCLNGISPAQAQNSAFSNENRVYSNDIKTVLCYNRKKEQSLPLYALRSNETLVFGFDDLRGGHRNLTYTVEHCNADWQASALPAIDYLESFSEDIIHKYSYSYNTLQKYTHYELIFPNEKVKPKISGNYILKVYEDGNKNKPLVSQRIYVLDPRFSVAAQVVPSSDVSSRNTQQKVNFTIAHPTPIQNPTQEIRAIVMQNANPLTAISNRQPAFVRPGMLTYDAPGSNEFWGSNEYRKFDIRSFRYKAAHVQNLFSDTLFHAVLFPDVSNTAAKYTHEIDDNGNFFIRNQDGRQQDTDSDYAWVSFSLQAAPPVNGEQVYVMGRFNQYQPDPAWAMRYDPAKKRYLLDAKLKQGVYDYQYIRFDANKKADNTTYEGTFFETENSYQVFVYYRRPGSRWEELAGFAELEKKQR